MNQRPARLWWMYLLAAAMLANLGGGAALAGYHGYRLGGWSETTRCLAERGLVPRITVAPGRADWAAMAECAAALNLRQAVVTVLGMVLLPVAAWALMVAGALWTVRRLRRVTAGGRWDASAAARAAVARFDLWCDMTGLVGRRRPTMVLVPPGFTATAYTTGLPLGRPVVVVPVSLAFAPRERFDLEILHELTHVRARDVSWASAVWWTGWIGAPAMLVAVAPVATRFELVSVLYGRSLLVTLVLSVAVLLVRALVLRRRELAADRYAVAVLGGTDALRAAVGGAGPEPLLRRLFATHPGAAVRSAADHGRATRWEGGALFSTVAGLVTMYLFQQGHYVASGLSGGRAPVLLPIGVAALVWALVVVPTWARRAAAPGPPRWVGPVAGTALGFAVGYWLGLPGAVGGVPPLSWERVDAQIAMYALAGATAAALAVGTAAAATGAAARVFAVVVAATGVLTTVHSAFLTYLVTAAADGPDRAGLTRASLYGMGDGGSPMRFAAPLLLVAAAAMVTGPGGWRPVARACLPVVAAGAVVGGAIAGAVWLARIGPETTDALRYQLVAQRL